MKAFLTLSFVLVACFSSGFAADLADKERSEIETALLMADIEFKRWKLIGDCLTEINQSFLLYGNVSPEDMMRVIDVHGRKLFKEYWAENKK